ncbi:hypothetical protein [Sideroxydans sp. CL21]|uniref:hypothetical protein n=1 Tax=Sideroxydans sp. CL21 TaxID=2600596 RepID=UPI0024BBF652|nr:hypothetical protein [Sideroxydans sp. CL21]
MLRNSLCTIAVTSILAGCATKPVEIDNTPLHATAVIERQIVNNGIKGFFPTESTEQNFVRSNMRRDESMFKGTGTFSGYLIGKKSGTKISRIDRNLQWQLDTEKQEYTECPLKGCAETAKRAPPKQNDTEQPPKAQHESGCTMTIANTSFTVKSTGQKKTINGFDTDEYQVAWVVKLRDNTARNSTSTMNMDIWTTPVNRSMRDALDMEESYARAYAGAVANTVKQQILPSDAAKLISAYMSSSLKQADLKAFLDAGRQMEKIKGYPISTHLEWNMAGNACAAKETKKESSSQESIPSGTSGLVSSLTGMFVKKKTDEAMKEADGEPILSFTVEVKSLKLDQLHDSLFTVPESYRLVSGQ